MGSGCRKTWRESLLAPGKSELAGQSHGILHLPLNDLVERMVADHA